MNRKAIYHTIFERRKSPLDSLDAFLFVGIHYSGPIPIQINIADFKKRKSAVLWGHEIRAVSDHTQSFGLFSQREGNSSASGYGSFIRAYVTIQEKQLRGDLFFRTDTLFMWFIVCAILVGLMQGSIPGIFLALSIACIFLIFSIQRDLKYYKQAFQDIENTAPVEL